MLERGNKLFPSSDGVDSLGFVSFVLRMLHVSEAKDDSLHEIVLTTVYKIS